MSRDIKITVEIELERDDDRFYATVPALKGLHVDGATEQEALEAVLTGINEYIGSLIKHGDPLPVGIVVQAQQSVGAGKAASRMQPTRHSRIVTAQVHCPA